MKKNGFTLAELLITMGIIGATAALVLPAISNIVPDSDKARVIKYNAQLNNAIADIFSDPEMYRQERRYNEETQRVELSCDGLMCVNNGFPEPFLERLMEKIGIEGQVLNNRLRGRTTDNASWTIVPAPLAQEPEFVVTIDIKPESMGCLYALNCTRNIDIFRFRIDSSGDVLPLDPLTDAYLSNPLNMHARKDDYATAQQYARQRVYN